MLKLAEVLSGWSPTPAHLARDPIVLLEAGWEEIVGSDVARNSHPTRIAEGTLTITTRSSAWSHQLTFLADHILRAVTARLPAARVEQLRFRVGRLASSRATAAPRAARASRRTYERPESHSAIESLTRFRDSVEARRSVARSTGTPECLDCGASLTRGRSGRCTVCAVARDQALAGATARLLFEAPWLGYAGTAALVDGLQQREYERVRSLMLDYWWGILRRARAAKQLSRTGREREIASSYVLLRSKLPPEEIAPATVRSILGDELDELLYGDARKGDAMTYQKRRT